MHVRVRGLAALVVLYLVIAFIVPRPEAVTPQGWRQTAIFICVIAGMVTEPLPASALVLLGLDGDGRQRHADARGAGRLRRAVGVAGDRRDADRARSMLDCGLARRIALLFVRAVGKTSLGVAYALQMTDVTLASGVPSITARSAGMMLPVAVQHRGAVRFAARTRRPRASARFLIAAMYQGSAVACAMFITGQASNLLGANLAAEAGQRAGHRRQLVHGGDRPRPAVVPGGAVDHLPRAAARSARTRPKRRRFAREELQKMGPLSRDEWITLLVFAGVGLLWLTTVWHRLDVTLRRAARARRAAGHRHHAVADGRRASGRRGTCSSGTAACCGWASC